MTTGRGAQDTDAAGGPARHIPVLLEEVLAALAPQSGARYIDATFGAGGYSQAILALDGTQVLALDRDPLALARAAEFTTKYGARFAFAATRFGDLATPDTSPADLEDASFDGVVFDIGVSSMQIDEALRGFSFRHDGPLDMRMGQAGRSAADILAQCSEEEIADILYLYGEERASRRIARAIVHDRDTTPFTSTRQLAELMTRLLPSKPNEIHPATRTFQALRIAVNDELGELVRGLSGAERLLRPGGRLVVVSFHSLEDRIVKQFLAARSGRGRAKSRLLPGEIAPPAPTFEVTSGRVVLPSDREAAANPRSRSARLRFAIRTDAPARSIEPELLALSALPQRQNRGR